MAYSTLQKIKIRLGQYHMNESGEVEFDQQEKNPLIEHLVEQINIPQINRRDLSSFCLLRSLYMTAYKLRPPVNNRKQIGRAHV